MPPLRPLRTINTRALSANVSRTTSSIQPSRAPSQISATSNAVNTQISKATFSSSVTRPAANHDDQYDPPTGWLFGTPPGEKYEREGWEGPMTIFCGALVLTGVAYAYKPDTSIQTWALEEARRRLEAEGILEDPFPNGVPVEDASKNQ